MKISLNIVKQLTGMELPPVDELVDRINRQLGGVEEIIDLGAKYKDAKIVKVVECVKHPNADKLSLCQVDVGEADLVQIVCGANNVKADMWAVWLPPESIVPSTYGSADEFRLGARELRGEMSHGMLASAKELGIGDDHDGIVDITEHDVPNGAELSAGASFAEVFGLDDTIIDIENKMFTHRPDLFGQLGVAREISAILQLDPHADEPLENHFENPEWYLTRSEFDSPDDLDLTVFNEAGDAVPRFMAVAIKNITVTQSPLWLKCQLVAMGGKPINSIVDATNYIMLMTAQPTHAYDYDKLRGHSLGTRMAKQGETIRLLNDKTYELDATDIVIVDGEGPVGLGGIMGGGNSEVSAETKNIVLEVANFDMYAVRKSSMRHGVFTDALTRFNKGQSALMNDRILAQLMTMVGGQQASVVHDLMNSATKEALDNSHSYCSNMPIVAEFVNQRLGIELNETQIGNILRPANFAAHMSDDNKNLLVTAPPWRTDIEYPEDIVEEVGRLYGFDKLPRELPSRSTKPVAKNQSREAMRQIRDVLSNAGANEVLTYSFVHENILTRVGQNPDKAYKLSNALSPDLQYYRLSVLPSLIANVHMNIKAGHDEFTLFEIGKAHHKDATSDDGLPVELGRVAGVYAAKQPGSGAPYYACKRLVQQLTDAWGMDVHHQPLAEFDAGEFDGLRQLMAPFDAERSAMLWIGDKFIGVIGEFTQSVLRNFKLPEHSAGFELFLSPFENNQPRTTYTPLSRYPSTTQDISLRHASDIRYADVNQTVRTALADADADVSTHVQPLSIYRADDSDTTTTTFRITLTHQDKTLTDADASQIVQTVISAARDEHGAEQV